MALAAAKTWNAGDVLTAADLNTLNTNILNNPISLISPTTGAINFQTSVAHTNLQVSALTASSGFSGSVLVASTATTPSPVWSTGAVSGGLFVATTASIPTWLALGTTGRLLFSASSGAVSYSTGVDFITTGPLLRSQRFGAQGLGTSLTSANFSLSTGWGAGATLGSVSGVDQVFQFTVTASAPTAANPSVTATFANPWPVIPLGLCTITGGTGAGSAIPVNLSPTSTGLSMQMFFTPTGNNTYVFSVVLMG